MALHAREADMTGGMETAQFLDRFSRASQGASFDRQLNRSVGPPKKRLWPTWPASSWGRAPAARSESCESDRVALGRAGRRATQPSQILGGLGSSRRHMSRPARSRAAGRWTVRRRCGSQRDERHAPPTLRAARPHAPRAAARPRTTSIGAFIVDRRNRVAVDAAPRIGIASARASRRRRATERGESEQEAPALATPRVASEPTPVRLTTRRRVSAGASKRETTFSRPPRERWPRITPSSAACGE
jgi:hypothetical protein